jgi:plastocyanin
MAVKRAVAAIAIVAGIGLTAWIASGSLLQQIPNHSATITEGDNATSIGGSTTTSTGETTSKSFFLGMNVVPTARLVPLGGRANFTLAFSNVGNAAGNYSLSGVAPPGLSFEFIPSAGNMSGCAPCGVDLRVRSSGAMEAGTYQVTIDAIGPKGSATQTFDFHVQRNLVLLSAFASTAFTNLTVNVGDTVTWVGLEGTLIDYPGHEVFFMNSTLRSGTLLANQSWSYTFDRPGIYRWYDNVGLSITGEVIVSP